MTGLERATSTIACRQSFNDGLNRDDLSALVRRGLFLFLLVLLLAVPQAALLPLLDRDEPRFAEASREMLQSGNIVVPTFNHAPRYAKPPLIYWTQAAAFTVFGENAFATRLPSLLATAGTAVLLFAWGAALGGINAGTIAALAYAFCLQVMQQGRAATADALLVFFTTLTAFAGWNLLVRLRGEKPGWNFWGTILALGFAGGFLAKGPEAWLPLLPLLFAARTGGARVIGAIVAIFFLGLLLVSWWAIPAYIQTGGAYWREGLGHDVGDRMVSGFQGHGAGSFGWYLLGVPLYFLTFWLSALPWSPLLVTHCKRLFASWRTDAADRYLLLNAALYFIVFSLMVTKLPHYTLPAFPFLALVFARRWVSSGLPCELPGKLTVGFVLAVALVALIAVPRLIMPYANPSPTGELVRKAGDSLTPGTEFALVDFQEPNTIWEMRRVVRGYAGVLPDKADVLGDFLRQPGPRAIVLSTPAWRQLQFSDPDWQTFSAHGWNAAKGSFVDLTLVVKK
jgi:4-amino-4-deoxy-L-arabinose transferase-like glycosyltransferase